MDPLHLSAPVVLIEELIDAFHDDVRCPFKLFFILLLGRPGQKLERLLDAEWPEAVGNGKGLPDAIDDPARAGEGKAVGVYLIGIVAADGHDRFPGVEGYLGDPRLPLSQLGSPGSLGEDDETQPPFEKGDPGQIRYLRHDPFVKVPDEHDEVPAEKTVRFGDVGGMDLRPLVFAVNGVSDPSVEIPVNPPGVFLGIKFFDQISQGGHRDEVARIQSLAEPLVPVILALHPDRRPVGSGSV